MTSSKSLVFNNNNSEPEKSVTLSIEDKTNKIFPMQTLKSMAVLKHLTYVKNLEREYEELQAAFLQLNSQYGRVQFRLRQLLQATPRERDSLIRDIARVTFNDFEFLDQNETEELPYLQSDYQSLSDIKRKQHEVIEKLRDQIYSLQKIGSSAIDLLTSYLQSGTNQAAKVHIKQKFSNRLQNGIKSMNYQDMPHISYREIPDTTSPADKREYVGVTSNCEDNEAETGTGQ